MSHNLHPSCGCTIISHFEPYVVSRTPLLIVPTHKAMDILSSAKRQRKVMTLGERSSCQICWLKVKMQHLSATITGSMIVGRTFPIVLFLIPKPSFSFKHRSQTFIFQLHIQKLFPNPHFPTHVHETHSQTIIF